VVATLIAVYGAGLVTPLGWKYSAIVWAYAFISFLATDPMKLLAYKVLDKARAESTPQAKAEPTAYAPTDRAGSKPGSDAHASRRASAKPKPEAKATA
jgi:H+-transporting ATPase